MYHSVTLTQSAGKAKSSPREGWRGIETGFGTTF